jgi:glucosamine-6-phosphate deaminase
MYCILRLLIMLRQAREVVVIVTGVQKALALQKCIEGGVNHMYTLSALQMHPHSMVVCDEDATLELQVKTVKVRVDFTFKVASPNAMQYFKSIEQVAKQFDMAVRIPNSMTTQGAAVDIAIERPTTIDGRDRQDSGAEMHFIVDEKKLAPSAHSISRATTPDLFPDSMGSRVAGVISRAPSPGIQDLSFDRMSSRIERSAVVV